MCADLYQSVYFISLIWRVVFSDLWCGCVYIYRSVIASYIFVAVGRSPSGVCLSLPRGLSSSLRRRVAPVAWRSSPAPMYLLPSSVFCGVIQVSVVCSICMSISSDSLDEYHIQLSLVSYRILL